jgi:catechol 2,3-dioxygenase-like lactoylglutathione lyase family enzyme
MDINAIEILTDNFDATVQFYAGLLEFEISEQHNNAASFLAGQSMLTFIQSNQLNPTYHFAFNIPCNKLTEALAWAASKFNLIAITGNEVIANFDSWNAKAFYFFDNNGNILEFIARFDLKNSTTKPFDSTSIQSISEIGIVTEDPLQFADTISTENNLPVFNKGSRTPQFVTLGDDTGLLIIVPTNRNWYPTDQPAGKFYAKITMIVNGQQKEITVH